MNTVLSVQVSLFHGLSLPTIPSPTTPRRPCAIVWFYGPQGLPPRLHLPMDRTYRQRRHLGFAITQQAHHDDRPNRVRHYPTDWSFTSCCSPPRLATTQLQSVTTFRPNFGEDLHLADSDHLQARCATAFGSERTMACPKDVALNTIQAARPKLDLRDNLHKSWLY
jgi:hypothetical protein